MQATAISAPLRRSSLNRPGSISTPTSSARSGPCKPSCRSWRAQASGHIITVSSIGGVIGFPTGGTYTATKFAIEAMSEGLAAEVEAFGINVTILEPGHFTTGFGSSARSAPAIEVYNPIRQAIRASFKPEHFGDPEATSAALFQAVDADKPPLRLALGTGTITKFRSVYEARLSNWAQWETVTNAAQGRPGA
ncbi:SDR family NAD(P)-dependent oxidoreductase [Rhizobium sp. OAE497]|uniref:SDR family NAD(P)-dependent oxidoreductase n=1 Tax=Rhizobium sp. OAE497 TaxID=2663796 RepID=UPI003396768B